MGSSKRALISGITGQDGSYLAELLLSRGYEVHGIVRRSSSVNTSRIDHIHRHLFLHYGDLNDASSLNRILRLVVPDEIYNLAAQSHVKASFDAPVDTGEVTALGVVRLLEAVRELETHPRIYQASSSEMFGRAKETPQNENTPFCPRSPYGFAKVYAYWATLNYREAHGMFAANGILFNHESPRRGESFVTRKITRAAGRIACGLQDCVYLGNLEARRDWGYAEDYVDGMWRILQQEEPSDFIMATGETHSVREFCERAFFRAGFDLRWSSLGVEERGVDRKSGRTLVRIDPSYYRPSEVDMLQGDARKAAEVLGWKPRTDFGALVEMMVDSDMRLAATERVASSAKKSVG